MIRRALLPLVFFLFTLPAFALDQSSLTLLNHAWPDAPPRKMTDIGRGVGVVFSPDLSVPGNCRFFESLGFACFQDPDWHKILQQIHTHQALDPEHRISTLVLETHGTNGNGLKVQNSYDPNADRSYISVGALQELLEPEGIYYVIISACNSGRLLRPNIYKTLDPNCGDKLFLPPNDGIINASEVFDPTQSPVMVITPVESHIETTVVGNVKELSPAAKRDVIASAHALGITPPGDFAISDMMMDMLVRDPKLQLAANHETDELSKQIQDEEASERNFRRFKGFLNTVAAREHPAVAHHKPAKKKTTAKRH